MSSQATFNLIFKSKVYQIPTEIYHLSDIKEDIYNKIIINQQYIVQSDVSVNVLESFIKYWINREIPNFNPSTITEYEQISEEFDLMKALIKLYKNFTNKLKISTLLSRKESLKHKLDANHNHLITKKEKYQKILQRLLIYNGIDSFYEFVQIKIDLHRSCVQGNLEQVISLTSKKIVFNDFSFLLDYEDFTAIVNESIDAKGDIFIPHSIEHQSKKFTIVSIKEKLFQNSTQIKSIQFPTDSELRSIGEKAFYNSSLESICIPSHVTHVGESCFACCKNLKSVKFAQNSEIKKIKKFVFSNSSIESLSIPSGICEFEDFWCSDVMNLTNIQIIENEIQNVSFFDGKLIVGKSDKNNEFFDVLVFASRDIDSCQIPSFIKVIAPYSFEGCKQLKTVEFAENSQLTNIEKFSFHMSSIQSISIPKNAKKIGESAFNSCKQLKKVDFQVDSELVFIEKEAFSQSSIEKVFIPKKVTQISENSFYQCKNLQVVEFSDESELRTINKNAFSYSSVTEISIPSNVTSIGKKSFSYCDKLTQIDLSRSIKLRCIEESSFSSSSIERLFIPSNVAIIEESSFNSCKKLKTVLFEKNSKLQSINKSVFNDTALESIAIPKNVTYIGENAFQLCRKLQKVEFEKDSKLELIQKSAFSFSMIRSITLPSKLAQICEYAFSFCVCLEKVQFDADSNLKTIEKYAFQNCAFESFTIPSKLSVLKECWCCSSENLKSIKIMDDNKNFTCLNNSIICGKSDPKKSDITDVLVCALPQISAVKIPSYIKKIDECAFYGFSELKRVILDDDSELQSIGREAFYASSIESFFVPQKVTKIGFDVFYSCRKLQIIEIAENSELKSINEDLFRYSSLRFITIQPKMSEILKFYK
ncbi:hypothetical protein M9Y10_006999 [Tritrichomonas musculus]|uniref:Surface antigen BspA-like n=1 Tax=Tritrichomonas musculus TaxID=1915356 RepID=A0ABR2J232_9EUKA